MTEQAAVIDLGLARLVALDRDVDAAEGEGLRARWEFGRELLGRRVGSKLPKGLLDQIAAETGKGREELKKRMQFASRFPDKAALGNAVTQYSSWHVIVNDALPRLGDAAALADTADPKPLPAGTFRVIVADPPWQYSNRATRGAAEDHYATMSIEELCELPVPERLADDAHLYLWTTNGFLREAFDVMDAWEFAYKTCLTWVKPQMGMGNYFRSSTEHVLFGVRGSLRTQDRALMNWFNAPRGKHSAKPGSFYDLVEKASPGPYLEMFARVRRLGWTPWGFEA
jgi:N6-adenosine-specific RNA methylase IME4